MNPPILSILVVDDHPIVRCGLCNAIDAEMDMRVCGQAGSAEEGVAMVKSERPDAVVLDLNLRESTGWSVLDRLKLEGRSPRILVLSVNDELVYAERVLRYGALGYLMKSAPITEVLQAIRRVSKGHVAVSDQVATTMLTRKEPRAGVMETRDLQILSDRELQVFEFLVGGLNNEEIAERVGVSSKTISTYKARLMRKLGARTTPQLISIMTSRLADNMGGN